MEFIMRPIGVIRTPYTEKEQTPIQASRSQTIGTVEIDQKFKQGLQDLEGFSHIILIYIFHASSGYSLRIKPFLDHQERGLFATRYPHRPNPIGISTVELLSLNDNKLTVQGIDVLDNTPLLDIKPYMSDFDERKNARVGWYATRSIK